MADNVTIRYYVDNETTPSIEFVPSLACGVGFDDQSSPWATRWIGKGAKSTGWFHNIRVPFSSVRITYQLVNQTLPDSHAVWMIVRGTEGMSLTVGDVALPASARLRLFATDMTLKPLEFVDLVNLPNGTHGMYFMTMVRSRTLI